MDDSSAVECDILENEKQAAAAELTGNAAAIDRCYLSLELARSIRKWKRW